MNISNQIRIVSLIWLLAGIALMILSAIELCQIGHNSYLGINSGVFKATLIAVGFSSLYILSSTGLMFNKNWGRILILLSASISLLYAAAYLLMGGFGDTGLIYVVIVSGLSLLSISTFAIFARKRKSNEWAT